jgi:chromate transporter
MPDAILIELATIFARLSLMAVGGVNPLLPEMNRIFVQQLAWLSDAQFATLFAITQGAPGPNILVVAAIGWQIAGIPGALVSLGAICAPSAILAGWCSRLRQQLTQSRRAKIFQRGLIPITVGLIGASSLVLARGAAQEAHSQVWSSALTLVTIGITIRYNPHPLWLLASGALIGLLGLV